LASKETAFVETLKPYFAESLWKLGKWDQFEQVTCNLESQHFSVSLGKMVKATIFDDSQGFEALYSKIVQDIATSIGYGSSSSYRDAYEAILKAHLVSDLQLFAQEKSLADEGTALLLKNRISCSAMSFAVREPILNLHRVLIENSICPAEVKSEYLGKVWHDIAKLSRKCGFKQTAYASLLHASELGAYCSHLESAKFFWCEGNHQKAMKELLNFLKAQAISVIENTEDLSVTRLHSVSALHTIAAKVPNTNED